MQASAAPSTRAKANKGTPYSSPRALCAWPTRRPCRRRAQLCPAGECLAAFLDDVYLVTTLSRAREALDVVTTSLETWAGVAATIGAKPGLQPRWSFGASWHGKA